MKIPDYPNFEAIDISMKEILYSYLNLLTNGISEFTFASFFIHRNKYQYKVSRISENQYIFSGIDLNKKTFFLIPGEIPSVDFLKKLLSQFDYWNLMSKKQAEESEINFRIGKPYEDRDNWDYLYTTEQLATLSGKVLHKKRNLVNSFTKSFSPKIEPLVPKNVKDAMFILDKWLQERNETPDYKKNDYIPTKEALNNLSELGLSGIIVYIEEKPVGFSIGERFARGTMYAVHFEKGLNEYKGIYQFVNMEFAKTVPNSIKIINREQDLGDIGMRQAKETYRPVDFTQKFWLSKKEDDFSL